MPKIRFEVVGKRNGEKLAVKRNLPNRSAAEKLKTDWSQNGASVIIGTTYEKVTFDSIEITRWEVVSR